MQHCPSSVMNILCYHSNINYWYNRNNITTDGPLLRLPEPEGPLRLPEPEGPLRLPEPDGPLRLPEPEGPLRLPKADGLFIKLICRSSSSASDDVPYASLCRSHLLCDTIQVQRHHFYCMYCAIKGIYYTGTVSRLAGLFLS